MAIFHQTSRAFFSYSRDDAAFALRLAADLKAAGAAVWMDQLSILPGERWDHAIECALGACPQVLVLLSTSAVSSVNVMDEVSFALEEQKTLIPILYRDCVMPFRLRRLQYIDFRGDYGAGLAGLVSLLTANGSELIQAPTAVQPADGEGLSPEPTPDDIQEPDSSDSVRLDGASLNGGAERHEGVTVHEHVRGSQRSPLSDREKSIAVLPFVNISADADNEFFSDGLTEELITDLSRIRALRVISRTSSMQQKNSTRGLKDIGRDLGVAYLLTGSVRKAGTTLRITAQLVDASTDAQLWAEKYRGAVDDVFDVQERVSRAIVDALDVTLGPEESQRLRDRPISNVRAFELYLQARQLLREYNVSRALPLIERALSIEGEVPALRALRAMSVITSVRAGVHKDMTQLATAEAEARALIAHEPDSVYGHALLGYAAFERGQLREGVRALRRALQLDPADQDIQFHLGISLECAGQAADAFELGQRMLANDPLSPMAGTLAGSASWFVGRPAEGIGWMERSLELAPDSPIHRWALGYHYCLLGRTDDAERHGVWMQSRVPSGAYTVHLRSLAAGLKGRRDDAAAILEPLDLSVLDGHQLFHASESFTVSGDTAGGMRLLELAIDKSFYPYDYIARHCPFLEPLRGHSDFHRLLAKAARHVAEFGEGAADGRRAR